MTASRCLHGPPGLLLFVYGTLRSDSGHAMHAVLVRGAQLVGRGEVDGALVDLGDYPGLVLGRACTARDKL